MTCRHCLGVIGTSLLVGLAVSAQGQTTPYAQGPLLDIIQTMPEGAWARVNANSFSDVWTPAALRPLYSKSNPPPSKIISSWSSFAWDSKRGDLILYGGGHANYSGNDVYRWRARDLQWGRAALPSETLFVGSNTWNAIDGADAAPTSAHTYDNAVYLPVVDRYLNFGGAIYNTGGAYTRPSESDPTVLRHTGPYLFDPSRADPDKVGGTTGSHVQRVAPYSHVVGGNMWENRDIHRHLAHLTLPRSHVSGCTAYSQSPAGHDVVFVGARTGGTALDLYRYEITDLDKPWLDDITRVGRYWSSPSRQTTCAHDPLLNIVLRTGTTASPFFFWDLNSAGTSNSEQRVAVTGSVKDFVDHLTSIGRALDRCAMDYDPVRATFLLWCGAGEVWSVIPPLHTSTQGWEVMHHPAPAGEVPPNNVGTGILGKWEYIPGFDVFIGLENSTFGNIWVYKPANWTAPEGSGDPLAVTVNAELINVQTDIAHDRSVLRIAGPDGYALTLHLPEKITKVTVHLLQKAEPKVERHQDGAKLNSMVWSSLPTGIYNYEVVLYVGCAAVGRTDGVFYVAENGQAFENPLAGEPRSITTSNPVPCVR